MLDQKILDRARALIHPEIERRRKPLWTEIQRVLAEMSARGIGTSTMTASQVFQLCENELRDRTYLAWDKLQVVLRALRVEHTSSLAADLKHEIGIHCREAALELRDIMAPTFSNIGFGKELSLDNTENQVKQELSGQIDLFVDSLAINAPTATTIDNASKVKIFETAFDIYEVIKPLGEGGAGQVFAVKSGSNERFALKSLSPERITTERRKRFKNEIAFCSKYEHRNIIQVHDSGISTIKDVKCPFYVMPEFPMTLRNLLDQGVSHESALPLFTQILDGMDAAHKLKVFHRDLKPENILYDPSRNLLVIADFGIAHFEEDIIATAVETKVNAKMANLGYSAPEQRIKGAHVDHRADIFALGLILNEMFTGKVPHGAGYKLIAAVAPELAYLDPLVEQMIQNDPAARPDSIDAIKSELISRGLTFVALQRVDALTKEVVPLFQAERTDPIRIISADWDNDRLTLGLNRVPEIGWVQRFKQPSDSYNYMMGAEPVNFQFNGAKAIVGADAQSAQSVIDYAKGYVEMANRGYQTDLDVKAKQEEQAYREKLRQEQAAAEVRARVISKLKV